MVVEGHRGVHRPVQRTEATVRLGDGGADVRQRAGVTRHMDDLPARPPHRVGGLPSLRARLASAEPDQTGSVGTREVQAQLLTDSAGTTDQQVDTALPEDLPGRGKLHTAELPAVPTATAQREYLAPVVGPLGEHMVSQRVQYRGLSLAGAEVLGGEVHSGQPQFRPLHGGHPQQAVQPGGERVGGNAPGDRVDVAGHHGDPPDLGRAQQVKQSRTAVPLVLLGLLVADALGWQRGHTTEVKDEVGQRRPPEPLRDRLPVQVDQVHPSFRQTCGERLAQRPGGVRDQGEDAPGGASGGRSGRGSGHPQGPVEVRQPRLFALP